MNDFVALKFFGFTPKLFYASRARIHPLAALFLFYESFIMVNSSSRIRCPQYVEKCLYS